MYIISRCLLGVNCKYNGGHNRNEQIIEFCKEHSCFSVCPETSGGLPSPRPPAEQQKVSTETGEILTRVIDREGKDVTEAFFQGARIELEAVLQEAERRGEPIEGAILKGKSPSCGSRMIYDGTFSGNTIPGNGIFADMLQSRSIPVYDETNFLTEIETLNKR